MSFRFVTYARKSSSGESKQIVSIPDQERVLTQAVDYERLTVVRGWTEARSAMVPHKRPAYREMLDFIAAGHADAILCWHLNRLARNELEGGELSYLLQTGAIKCIKTPEREYHPEDHALLMAIEWSAASQYVRDLSRDVRRGRHQKAERGWHPGKAKPGYRVDEVTRDIVPDRERFLLLRRACDLMLTGAYSVPQIFDILQSWGYRSARTRAAGDKPMTRSGLYRFFHDRFYSGEFWYDGAWRPGRHEPMLSRSEFESIQRTLRKPEKAKHDVHFHPYAGLLRCGVCGCMITAETHVKRYKTTGTTRSYSYYHCTGRKGCPKASIAAQDLKAQFIEELTPVRLDPEFYEWALAALKRDERESKKRVGVSQTLTTSHAEAIRRKLDRLFTMRENEEITAEEFKARKARHEGELRAIEQQVSQASAKVERDRETLTNILTFTRDWHETFTGKGPLGERLVASVFTGRRSYAVLTLGKLTVTCHPALDRIRTFERTKSPAQQIGPGDSGVDSSVWRALWEELRTLVAETDEGFARLEPGNLYHQSP